MNKEKLLKELISYARENWQGFFEQEWLINEIQTKAKQYLNKLNKLNNNK